MVRTFGLNHIALAVRDVDRSAQFYHRVPGAVEVCRHAGFVRIQTPGSRDAIVLEQKPDAGKCGVIHFGFRLVDPADIDAAAAAVCARLQWLRNRNLVRTACAVRSRCLNHPFDTSPPRSPEPKVVN